MKKWQKTILSLASIFTLAACGAQEGAADAADSTTATAESEATVTIEDARGSVEVPKDPKNVAVLDFGHLDTLIALGKEDAVTGTATENMPAYLADKADQFENVGTLKEPNVEALANLAPELIIISNRLVDFAEQLEEIAPVVVLSVDYTDYWGSAQKNIATLGTIFDEEAAADEAIATLNEEIEAVQAKTAGISEKTLTLLLNDGSMSAFSTGSRFGFIYDTLGFTPVDAAIEDSTHGQSVGYEGLLEINPQILFVVDRTAAIGTASDENAALLENDFVYQTDAYKNNKIINLSSDLWYLSGGGIESIHLMVEEVAADFQ
ncbi:ABC transporter substrate-binding protein [Trichococcus sp. K1Tr]|jgi:iron complex transport system substrate-binding protein|uniref:siderophore ABC transporter substrate-binding protein n=1 Tax=Trichococcus sp. K1Tr TaxID=3020847 RepID=UPI0023308846|nr:ABC transporter substrate-binding protein [Trichococcus sp. K1Tr]MDB6352486.1 ABC transporter substrate-binding protein [Trichococcus sp. K1Tr]